MAVEVEPGIEDGESTMFDVAPEVADKTRLKGSAVGPLKTASITVLLAALCSSMLQQSKRDNSYRCCGWASFGNRAAKHQTA
jgi:hypothetical protein